VGAHNGGIGAYANTHIIWNDDRREWRVGQGCLQGRVRATLVPTHHSLLLLSGSNGVGRQLDSEIYNPSTNVWSRMRERLPPPSTSTIPNRGNYLSAFDDSTNHVILTNVYGSSNEWLAYQPVASSSATTTSSSSSPSLMMNDGKRQEEGWRVLSVKLAEPIGRVAMTIADGHCITLGGQYPDRKQSSLVWSLPIKDMLPTRTEPEEVPISPELNVNGWTPLPSLPLPISFSNLVVI
jgi:hypothetical protein